MKDHKTAGGFQEVGSRKRVLSQRPRESRKISTRWHLLRRLKNGHFPRHQGRSLQVSKKRTVVLDVPNCRLVGICGDKAIGRIARAGSSRHPASLLNMADWIKEKPLRFMLVKLISGDKVVSPRWDVSRRTQVRANQIAAAIWRPTLKANAVW